jgi:hypothetical protein
MEIALSSFFLFCILVFPSITDSGQPAGGTDEPTGGTGKPAGGTNQPAGKPADHAGKRKGFQNFLI